jgi:muconate cycloisomerase
MSLVRSVGVYDIALPPRRDWRWAGMSEATLGRWVLVRVETEDGATGWGEAAALGSWNGETPATVRHAVEAFLAPAVLGRSAFDRPALDGALTGHPYAKAALEMALWDVRGRLVGAPVHALLGGAARPSVAVAHMVGLMTFDAALAEAREVAAAGALALQVKGGQDLERDVRLVAAIREAVGEGVALRLDANRGYDRLGTKAAAAVVRRLHAAGAALVEQPVSDAGGLRAIAARTEAGIVADESCWTAGDALALAGGVDALSIYVAKAAGLAGARHLAEVAQTLGLPCDVNGSLESAVGNAANLHLAVAMPAVTLPCVIPVSAPAGAHAGPIGAYWADDVVGAPFPFADGRLAPPPGPGLGIEVDEERVRALAADRHRRPAAPKAPARASSSRASS